METKNQSIETKALEQLKMYSKREDVLKQSNNRISWDSWGATLRINAEIYACRSFEVTLGDPAQVKEWKKQLGLTETETEQNLKLAVVVSIAIIKACVAIILIAAFAGIVAYALALGYSVDAELDHKTGLIKFIFIKPASGLNQII